MKDDVDKPSRPQSQTAPEQAVPAPGFPATRLRRPRQAAWSRRLVCENALSVDDLIWPIFIIDGENKREPVASMPGVERLSVDLAVKAAEDAARYGIPVIEVFPNTPNDLRTADGADALNPDNLACRAVRKVKAAVPEIGVMCDVALDPYTNHGHDGLLDADGRILNDATLDVLVQQSLVQAEAGCDILGPSDMMDGRIGVIRQALEDGGFSDVQLMSYTAKYASGFFNPFRDAVGSSGTLTGDKKTYQMDFGNSDEALREAELDIAEGADMIMVKPGLAYLDILYRLKSHFAMPTFAYQVSGEYSMLMAAVQNGWLDGDRVIEESLIAFKRAGADGILTYFALDMAKRLKARS